MNQDLQYWKSRILYDETTAMLKTFQTVEERSESPIETIATITLFHLRVYFGTFHLFIQQQVEVDKYRVDILVTYRQKGERDIKIVVECDGHEFHEKTKDQAARDKERDRALIKLGYKVLHYTGSEICNNPLQPVADIVDIIRLASEKDGDKLGT